MDRIIEKESKQEGNKLQVKFHAYCGKNETVTKYSREYLMSDSSLFQVKLKCYNFNILILVRFKKKRPHDNLKYVNNFSSVALEIKNKSFVSDEGMWHVVSERDYSEIHFDIAIRLDIVPSVCSFAALHGDTELTDFELRGEDGSVRMHRAVLAASSPVFRTMLGGAWKETAEGCVEVPGTSVATLQHFKDYIYRHTLPESGLEQLLELAAYYTIPELEHICIYRLVDNLTGANVTDLLDFASKHKMMRLIVAIFARVESGAFKVDEMRKHLLPGESMYFNTKYTYI